MKRQDRRLEKLEESLNPNDKRFPLVILIERQSFGGNPEETIHTQIIIGGGGMEKPKRHYRVLKGEKVFVEDGA